MTTPPVGDDSRSRLLAAGRQLLADVSPDAVLPGVRPTCTLADRGTSSFYWFFADGQAEFQRILLASVFVDDPIDAAIEALDRALDHVGPIHDDTAEDPLQVVSRALVRGVGLGGFDGTAPFRSRMLVTTTAATDHPLAVAARAAGSAAMAARTQAVAAIVEGALARVGRRPHRELGGDRLARVALALLDGLVARAILQPGPDDGGHAEQTVALLLGALSEPSDGVAA